jgi:predicted RNA binding protein YcfA (HicA-like mRNA interferase family)
MTKLPQIKGDRLVKALLKEDWYIDRTSGSHVIMRNNRKTAVKVVIPVHSKPIKPGILSNILKTTGLTVEEIKALL